MSSRERPLTKSTSVNHFKTQLTSTAACLNTKIENLVCTPHLNRSYDLFTVLSTAGRPVKLRIPETLLVSEGHECFLGTDQRGLVTVDRETG